MPIPFPTELIRPRTGKILGAADEASLQIPLEPFRVGDEEISTEMLLDLITLPSLALEDLQGTTHDFPLPPSDDAIEGSVYIVHAHHPVDVSSIEFGDREGDSIRATIKCRIQLDFEGLQDGDGNEYENTELELRVLLQPE